MASDEMSHTDDDHSNSENSILKSWRGNERLWRVFWIYNFILGGLINYGFTKVGESENLVLLLVYSIFALAYMVWVLVSLWRCAFNANWQIWGYIARVLVVLMVVFLALGFAEIFLDAEG